jgi:hypothetical protein
MQPSSAHGSRRGDGFRRQMCFRATMCTAEWPHSRCNMPRAGAGPHASTPPAQGAAERVPADGTRAAATDPSARTGLVGMGDGLAPARPLQGRRGRCPCGRSLGGWASPPRRAARRSRSLSGVRGDRWVRGPWSRSQRSVPNRPRGEREAPARRGGEWRSSGRHSPELAVCPSA